MKTLKAICLLLTTLLLTGCGDAPELPRLSQGAVILAFGDSLTRGNGAREEESYPAVLEKLSGRKVINAGVSGEISKDGLNRLSGLLEKHKPQLLILCHGGNDILRKKSKEQMASNLVTMIKLAQNRDIPVVLLGMPDFGLFLSPAKQYREIADATDAFYIENLIPDVLSDNSLKSDTVHPNKNGYRVMAETIYRVLQDAGAL